MGGLPFESIPSFRAFEAKLADSNFIAHSRSPL